jgi:hypothetical protein
VQLEDKQALIKDDVKVKEAFATVHNYLKSLHDDYHKMLQSQSAQKGIKAIVEIAEEAAVNFQKYQGLIKGVQDQPLITEFQDLYDYYLNKIAIRVETALKEERDWQKSWEETKKEVDSEKKSLRDLEVIRRDQRYELFLIRDEGGKPFFNKSLLRHIRLVGDIDDLFVNLEGDDPFLAVQGFQDLQTQKMAQRIIERTKVHMDAFFKEGASHKEEPFIAELSKACMALFLSANRKNILENNPAKNSSLYYHDFILFLRAAKQTGLFQRFSVSNQEPSERYLQEAFYLANEFALCLFTAEGDREGVLRLLHHLMPQVKKTPPPFTMASPLSFWHNLLNLDEKIRLYLRKYPNGPLMRALDLLREEGLQGGFDPLVQGNVPNFLYSFAWDHINVGCLRFPCPTRQQVISKAEITEEFLSFLSTLKRDLSPQKLLIFNLQERNTLEEHARSIALEQLQNHDAFSNVFRVVGLPKSGPFYHQTEDYFADINPTIFMDQFYEQLESGELCGFFLKDKDKKVLLPFATKLMKGIEEGFFADKKILTRKNRLDFIEIFYLFFILAVMDYEKPDMVSFVCKDGIDTGACMAAGFYTFLKLLISDIGLKKEDELFVEWLLYAPALLLRDRAVDSQRLHRMVSSLGIFHGALQKDRAGAVAFLKQLLPKGFLESITVSWSAC